MIMGTFVFETDPVGVGVGVKLLVMQLCNLNALWNVLMILSRNVDQDEMTCHIQDWQLWLSYFWSSHPLFYLKKTSCPLCNSSTLWNISMVLGRNVEQDQTTCLVQEWQLCLSYFWRYLPLLYLTVIIHWFHVRSISQRPFGIFLWYLVENQEQDQTTLPFLLLALSPFVMSDTDYPLISCPLCKSKTLWNFFMILGRNVEQDQTTYWVLEWHSGFLTFGVISFCFVWNRFLLPCNWNTLQNNLMVPGRTVE